MKKAVLWTLPFLLGLSIAWCGAQLTEGRSASEPSNPSGSADVFGTTSLAEPPSSDTTQDGAAGQDEEQAADEDTVAESPADPSDGEKVPAADGGRLLSPLADSIQQLGSALPEEALVGVGEPLGFTPLALSIADLDVSTAPVEPVGIEENGELEVPGAEAIGWYQFGSGIGGGRGSTVLAGHIAYNGVDGVFRNLDQMQQGQIISVEHDGAELSYEVTEVVQYTKESLPIEDLFREDGAERIVLITCGGSFNPSIRSYDDNVVVIAVPV